MKTLKLLKQILRTSCYFACGTFFSLTAYAQTEESSLAVNQLVEILSQSESMLADVEQLMLDQAGYEMQAMTVRLMMQKPDHFYWKTLEPYEELMVTNGEKLWVYEPDLDQVTIREFETDLSRSPVLLLNGDAESLSKAFEISRHVMLDDLHVQYVLLPKDPASLVLRLSLVFVDDVLEEMQYENSLGAKTSLTFSNLEVNVDIDSGLFEFEPPAGIDIIDTTAH